MKKVKKYKVIALSVGGRGNKIYHSKDIVSEKNFPEGNAEILVKKGFLKEIPDDEKVETIPAPPAIEGDVDTEFVEKNDDAPEKASEENTGGTGEENTGGTGEGNTGGTGEENTGGTGEGNTGGTGEGNTGGTGEENTGGSDADAKTKTFINKKGETVIVKTIEDINKKEIIAELKKVNYEFDSNLNKETLFPIWFNL